MPPTPASDRRVVLLHRNAPAKPAAASACNGCGLCCAHEPCPLGMLLSRRRRGRCAALRWCPEQGRYRCAALADPARWLPGVPQALARSLVRRWIAAGSGCDSSLEPC